MNSLNTKLKSVVLILIKIYLSELIGYLHNAKNSNFLSEIY